MSNFCYVINRMLQQVIQLGIFFVQKHFHRLLNGSSFSIDVFLESIYRLLFFQVLIIALIAFS
jgi:hypothetical protein